MREQAAENPFFRSLLGDVLHAVYFCNGMISDRPMPSRVILRRRVALRRAMRRVRHTGDTGEKIILGVVVLLFLALSVAGFYYMVVDRWLRF